jgi:hypothetical protein
MNLRAAVALAAYDLVGGAGVQQVRPLKSALCFPAYTTQAIAVNDQSRSLAVGAIACSAGASEPEEDLRDQ